MKRQPFSQGLSFKKIAFARAANGHFTWIMNPRIVSSSPA